VEVAHDAAVAQLWLVNVDCAIAQGHSLFPSLVCKAMHASEVDRAGSFEAALHAGPSKGLMKLLPTAGNGAVPLGPLAHEVGVYSPIQRLVDENGWDHYMPAGGFLNNSKCPPGTTLKDLGSYLLMYTERSQGTQLLPHHDTASVAPCQDAEGPCPHLEPDGYECMSDTDAERIGESAGATGDEYRFRYDRVSREEGYSPIAGVRPCSRSMELDERHVWSTHIDDDGAVCSRAIHGPLTLTVRVPDGSDVLVQVWIVVCRCSPHC
jgi:hypothetical protein